MSCEIPVSVNKDLFSLAHLYQSTCTGSYCCHPDFAVGMGFAITLLRITKKFLCHGQGTVK